MKTIKWLISFLFFWKKNRWITSLSCMMCINFLAISNAQETIDSTSLVKTDTTEIDTLAFSVFDKMYQDTILNLRLETEVKQFLRNKSKDVYQPAFLSFTDKDSVAHRLKVKIKARGKSRREFCNFPPIKLKFSKKILKANGLKEHNDIKLVTHCKDEMAFRQVVLKEYLIYKALNILSDYSMKVQLVKMEYVDTGKKNKKIAQYLSLIHI